MLVFSNFLHSIKRAAIPILRVPVFPQRSFSFGFGSVSSRACFGSLLITPRSTHIRTCVASLDSIRYRGTAANSSDVPVPAVSLHTGCRLRIFSYLTNKSSCSTTTKRPVSAGLRLDSFNQQQIRSAKTRSKISAKTSNKKSVPPEPKPDEVEVSKEFRFRAGRTWLVR